VGLPTKFPNPNFNQEAKDQVGIKPPGKAFGNLMGFVFPNQQIWGQRGGRPNDVVINSQEMVQS